MDAKLTALDPGDELYRNMPPHVTDAYRRAKAFRRQAQRQRFQDRMENGPAALSVESQLDFRP
jgi:hypothetical protein